jgi:hypothetical protein
VEKDDDLVREGDRCPWIALRSCTEIAHGPA